MALASHAHLRAARYPAATRLLRRVRWPPSRRADHTYRIRAQSAQVLREIARGCPNVVEHGPPGRLPRTGRQEVQPSGDGCRQEDDGIAAAPQGAGCDEPEDPD